MPSSNIFSAGCPFSFYSMKKIYQGPERLPRAFLLHSLAYIVNTKPFFLHLWRLSALTYGNNDEACAGKR